MAHSASVAAQRLDVLEAEVARLRQVIEERLAYPVPLNDEAEFLIPVTEAARLAAVSSQTIRRLCQRHRRGGAASGRHKPGKCRRGSAPSLGDRRGAGNSAGYHRRQEPGRPPHEDRHAALTLFDPGSPTRCAGGGANIEALAYSARNVG